MDKNVENNEPIKNRKRFSKVLNTIIITVAVILLAVEGVVYYQRSYLTPFWVNGQSMYPTLNYNAKDGAGNTIGVNGGGVSSGYTIDYGVMDCHKGAINRIKRFDIIVTKYSKNDTNNKIKRVLGLPGETIEFKITGFGNEHNGDLYINGSYVEEPLDSNYIRNANYPAGKIILGADEYYVCGDNRNHSSDSRNEDAIKKDWITGKVVAICGTATVIQDGAYYDVDNIDFTWPRYL